MKTNFIKTVVVIAISLLTFNSCKKGDTGPAGPEGPVGPAGPAGPTGTAGANGANGNANVVSYKTIVNSWSSQTSYWRSIISIPEITSATNTTGAILCYFSINSGLSWFALPYTQVDPTSNYYLNFNTYNGGITVFWQRDNGTLGSNPNAYYSTNVNIKTVIIPPALIKPNIDTNNYNEVKMAYNLAD